MRIWIGAVIVVGGLFLAGVAAGPASAGVLDFNLSDCGLAGLVATCNNSDSGHSVLNYVVGGLTLRASGFVGANPNNFDLKLATPDETGLGLFGATPANEVGPGDSEVFDLTSLAAHGITSGTATITSLQEGEVGLLTDATGAHVITEVDGTGIGTLPFSWTLANPIVTLTANSGDVLAAADVSVSVPEVGTLLLFATGLAGLGWLTLRRRMMLH